MSGRQNTWANSLQIPTYEKLDRILIATEWEPNFPHSSVIALTRDILDHTPLLLNTGKPSSNFNQSQFKFELGWLLRDGMDMVKEVWDSVDLDSTLKGLWHPKRREGGELGVFKS